MSDNKREQERTELYRTIWALANELRGSVDGWDFKQYVLGMLFYRYISENLTTYIKVMLKKAILKKNESTMTLSLKLNLLSRSRSI